MTTSRRFCRFFKTPETAPFDMTEIPEDGLCLSAFVLLSPPEHPERVLLGRINPRAPWDHLGAIDGNRLESWKDGWMIPSSHLIVLESPDEAGRRIVKEILGLAPRRLDGPSVVSEVYAHKRYREAKHHWDIGFLYRGGLTEMELGPRPAWTTLKVVDPKSMGAEEMVRAHEDILALAGFPVGTSPRSQD